MNNDDPASKAAWVDSICSEGVTGTAGLSFLVGTEPVIAQVTIHGSVIIFPYQIFSWEFEDNDHGLECQFSLDATFYNLYWFKFLLAN